MPLFPKDEIEKRLRDWWKSKTQSPLARKPIDAQKAGGTVFDIQPEVSSQEAVEVFLEIEPILGFELKGNSGIIKLGGYRSCDDFVKDLLPKLAARFVKHHPKEPERVKTRVS